MLKKFILNISFCLAVIASQAQALLPTGWNFSSPSSTTPPTGWTLNLGTNGNTTYAFGVGDAIACRLDATGENIVINVADKPGTLSYYLSPQNAGNPWGGQFDIQESNDGGTWSIVRSVTSKATTTTNFTNGKYTDVLKQTTRFVRFYYTTKIAGGSASIPGGNMALDSVLITAAPIAATPTIQVSGNTGIIGNNGDYTVGNATSFTFKVKNVGSADTLVIDSINFSGSSASAYAVTNTFPIKVASKDSMLINCTLNTSGNGSRLAAINIFNNDVDKQQFIANLYGIAGSLATEPLFKPVSVTFSNITAYGLNVVLADTATASTENYIVLRKRNGTITEVPVDGQTYQKGDYIGAAQVAYIGQVGSFKPTYILANNNYTFAAFAFNGPSTYENYLTSNFTSSSVQSLAGNAGSYYSSINTSAPTFIADLSAKVNPHDTIFYSNYITTVINNFLTRDTIQGKKVVNCVYTGIAYVYNEPFVWNASNSTGILTREHTRAQSTMPSNTAAQNPSWPRSPSNLELPEYNDQHNLFPADQINANGVRSNYPFGECVTVTSTSPTGKGKLGKDANNNTIYEPKDEQKGDLARALFYMSVCYNGINGNNWSLPSNQGLAVLLKWHQQDPPSEEEIARHEYIASVQHNRNPFIDNPSWANLIDFKTMTLIQNKVLTVNAPNGGENLIAGKTTPVIWLSANITGKVKLEYTTNGTDFNFIDSVNATTGNYSWTIPAVATSTAKIKVSATDNSISDLSNANFTISVPSLQLLTPVATDIWKGNDNKYITWQSAFVDSITIDLKDGSTLLWSIKEAAGKDSFSIAVPDVNANNAKVYITEVNGSLKDSSAAFKIEKSVSVREVSNTTFVVYPNPSNGTIYFNTNMNIRNATYELFDVTGKLMAADNLDKTNAIHIAQKGIYILKASIDEKTIIKKIVVE
ncbi:MAG: endonuclease [Bacteroidota bacterium]